MCKILQNHYVLAVHDLDVNARFFGQLGFEIEAGQLHDHAGGVPGRHPSEFSVATPEGRRITIGQWVATASAPSEP